MSDKAPEAVAAPTDAATAIGPVVACGLALALAAGAVGHLVSEWAELGQRVLISLVLGLPWAVLALQLGAYARQRRWRHFTIAALLLLLALILLAGA